MHIKKSLLDTLELPLALQHGIIGRLEIHIPWKTLAKDSVVINIDRVRSADERYIHRGGKAQRPEISNRIRI